MVALSRSISYALLLICALAALALAPRLASLFQAGDYYGLALDRPLPDVALRDARHQSFRISELRGEPFYVYFGYLRCRTVCPLSLRTLRGLIAAPAAQDVPILYVNLNPAEHDSDTLRGYQQSFGDRMIFAYGNRAQLIEAARAFHASFYIPDANAERGSALAGADEDIEHTDAIYLVDADMNLRFMYLNTRRKVTGMLDDLRLLREDG